MPSLTNRKSVCFIVLIIIGACLLVMLYQNSVYENFDISNYRDILPGPVAKYINRHVPNSTHDVYTPSRYAVYGVAVPDVKKTVQQDGAWQYVFYIPITAHAWWRLNVSSIIIMAGKNVSDKIWTSHPKLTEIYDLIKTIPHIKFVYLSCDENRKTMISQTARIFVSSFVPEIPERNYLITSDADLVPLSDSPYRTLSDDSVLLLNAYCCGTFRHNNTQYRMFPMSNIAATINNWKILTRKHTVSSAEDIAKVLSLYYKIPDQVQKGVNDGWYMDQHVVSILMEQAKFKKNLVRRSMISRIDRSNPHAWDKVNIGQNMIDAHMLLPGWKSSQRVKNLIHSLFKSTSLIQKLDTYIDKFDQ